MSKATATHLHSLRLDSWSLRLCLWLESEQKKHLFTPLCSEKLWGLTLVAGICHRISRAWSFCKDSRYEESQNEGFGVLICSSCVCRLLAGNPDSPPLITSGTVQNSLKPKSWRDCYGDWVLETVPCGLEKQEVCIRCRDLNFVSKIKSLNTAAVILLKFAAISGYVWMDSWCSKFFFQADIEIF